MKPTSLIAAIAVFLLILPVLPIAAPARAALMQGDADKELDSFLPDDDAKVLVMTYCTACHGASETRRRIASRAGGDAVFWNNLVRRMKTTWNAPIQEDDVAVIGAYLARHFGAPAPMGAAAAKGGALIVKAGLLIDGTGQPAARNVTILIQDGRISGVGPDIQLPEGAQVVDASRQVVVPGFIDTHVHLGERALVDKTPDYEDQVRQNLKQNLAFGITTVFSLGMDRDFIYPLREQSWNPGFPGSHILTAGRGFTAPGGHPTQLKLDLPQQTNDPAEARELVRQLAARKVDGVKIWFANIPATPDLPQIRPDVTAAIIDEAHKNGLRAMAHINTAADTRLLVNMGLDGITHIARDALDAETVALMSSQRVIVAPTLVQRKKALIFKEENGLLDQARVQAIMPAEAADLKKGVAQAKPQDLDGMRQSYEQAKDNVRRLRQAGVVLAVGTDANTAFAPPGLITQEEIVAFVDAGLTPMEALVAATRGSAQWAGALNRIGTIEPGKVADLLILDGNPLEDIRNIRRIAAIVLSGRVVDPLKIP